MIPYSKAYSASGLSLGTDQCQRAWYYRYVLQLGGEAEVPWAQIETWKWSRLNERYESADGSECCSSRQRSLALGKAVHAVLEAWYRGEEPAWTSVPGRIAAHGRRFLPRPEDCAVIRVEEPTVIRDGDIEIPGTADLVVKRFGAWKLIDHKTCRDFVIKTRDGKRVESQKSAETLLNDRQAGRYALPVIQAEGLPALECGWVYYRTDLKRPDARATAFEMPRQRAEDIVGRMFGEARVLRDVASAPTVDDLPFPTDTAVCEAYGGCEYHRDKGGPCAARKPIRAAIPEEVSPAMSSFLERLKAAQSEVAKTAPAPVVASPPPAAPAPAPVVASPPPPPAAPAPAPVVASPPPAAGPVPKKSPDTQVSLTITTDDGIYFNFPIGGDARALAEQLVSAVRAAR